jgi:hypothetical protein
MDVLIAIGHIAGSLACVFVVGISVFLFGNWMGDRSQKQELEEAASKLGVTVADLNNEEVVPKLIQLSSERFSSELLRNRLSDFCSAIQFVWSLLATLTQAAVLIAVVWYTFKESTTIAVYAWFIVGIAVFFSIVHVLFWSLCRLLTGRYPGQAKGGRKALAEFLKSRTRAVA